MAAYAAVVSLKHTTASLLLHSSRFSLLTQNNLTNLHQYASLLQDALVERSTGSNRLDVLEAKIRDATHQLEDALEFYESYLLSSEQESCNDDAVHLLVIKEAVTSFSDAVTGCGQELLNPAGPEEEDDDHDDGDDDGVVMVGHSSHFSKFRDHLLKRMRPDDMCFFLLFGKAVNGRSFIAKTIFNDVKERFEFCAWLTIGTDYSVKKIVLLILQQVNNGYESLLSEEDEEMACKYLYKSLEHRRYMIVLDDVEDERVWDRLRSSFPDQGNGSLVFLTTNQKKLTGFLQPCCTCTIVLRAGEFQTWGWFYLKLMAVIGQEDWAITAEFEQAAKEINENCRGSRLALAKTMLFLYKEEKTEEKWREIAADKEHPIFKVEDEISEVHRIKTEMQSHNWDMDDKRERLIATLIPRWIDFSPDVEIIKRQIHPIRFFPKMEVVFLLGMAGIGKTTYARRIIQDESILSNYDPCVWVTLGPKYQPEDILIDILAQIYPSIGKMRMKEDDNLVRELCVQLSSKRCLIVLDNLWSKEPLELLRSLFPDIKGRALVTTRLEELMDEGVHHSNFRIKLLDKEESWTLLRHRVFAEGWCPSELEAAAQKISEKCDGLPLLLHKVADQLLELELDPKSWNDVASGKDRSVFTNAHAEISKALLPSYKILPQHLKACFLYVGIFRERYDIPVSKLTHILIAEGFLEAPVRECLAMLELKSVLMVQYNIGMKSCRLHSVFWHLCNTIAVKNKFFHAMNDYEDCSIENLESQRRLCIRYTMLLGNRYVQESLAASVTSAHSFLCTGPPHQYPVPICFGMRLLRVMDALAIRQYEFPDGVMQLLHLRYLSLTYWGELPASISKLWKLQYLIVRQYLTIKSSRNSSLLPKEIWDMKELKHLQIMGGRLPNPEGGTGLPNLKILLDVSAQSCTREVLGMIPNLKRLGVRILLEPNDACGFYDCCDCWNNITGISRLESLKFVVVNPPLTQIVVEVPRPIELLEFPSSLKRLSLSGFGLPWDFMSLIGGLENLEVLKLKSYAFKGPKWEIKNTNHFRNLKILLIEDTDLVHWEIKVPSFPRLGRLSIKHCYKLRELPIILHVKLMEIVDCNPLTVTWAEQMRLKVIPFRLTVQRSWIDTKVHVAPEVEE